MAYEIGMSARVVAICKQYADALGYNFPPSTIQMINAIVEWVSSSTVRDVTDMRVTDSEKVAEGLRYTMEVTYSRGEKSTFKFIAPYGVGVKNVKIVEIV